MYKVLILNNVKQNLFQNQALSKTFYFGGTHDTNTTARLYLLLARCAAGLVLHYRGDLAKEILSLLLYIYYYIIPTIKVSKATRSIHKSVGFIFDSFYHCTTEGIGHRYIL